MTAEEIEQRAALIMRTMIEQAEERARPVAGAPFPIPLRDFR